MSTFLRRASDLQLNDTVPGIWFSVQRFVPMTGIVDEIIVTSTGINIKFRTRYFAHETFLQDYRTIGFKPDDLISVGL